MEPTNESHEAEINGGWVSLICCQGRFQEGLGDPQVDLALCGVLND